MSHGPGGGTRVVEFHAPGDRVDWLVAELDELGFQAFAPVEGGIQAFIPEANLTDGASLAALAKRLGVTQAASRLIPHQNWNEQWEGGIRPVDAGPFSVHPPWHQPTAGRIGLCIEPKMSFGTGHHETTRLILDLLPHVVTPGVSVLDAGTGTGVLAIAARKLGAGWTMGFDIDPWSRENAAENAARNDVPGIDFRCGDVEVLGEERFDVVLANINLGVLREMIPTLSSVLKPGGTAVLSGVLATDRSVIVGAVREAGWVPDRVAQEGEWIAVLARGGVGPDPEQ